MKRLHADVVKPIHGNDFDSMLVYRALGKAM